jgi:DNA-binding response OmpR family regulator
VQEIASPIVAILGDDLIWASRLADAVTSAGGEPHRARRLADFEAAAGSGAALAIVDLTARAYDGVEAVRAAAAAGTRVIAVGQHDDLALRKRALAAGAERVLAYRKLFEDGPAVVAALLAGGDGGAV